MVCILYTERTLIMQSICFSNHINRAFKVLKVKDQEPEVASQRLLIFTTARQVLEQGMKILGLQPLIKM